MKKILFGVVAAAAATILMAGCGTTGAVAANAAGSTTNNSSSAESGMTVQGTKTYLRDWTGRTLGNPAIPEWLSQVFLGNNSLYKETFKIADDDIVMVNTLTAADVRGAQIRADLQFARTVVKQLQQSIITNAGQQARSGALDKATADAVAEKTWTHAEADVSGIRAQTEWYHIVDEEDSLTGKTTRKCVLYQIYVVPQNTWAIITAKYLKGVIGDLAEDNLTLDEQAVMDMVNAPISDAREPTAYSPSEKRNQLKAQQKMIQAQASVPAGQREAAAEQALMEIAKEENVTSSKNVSNADVNNVKSLTDAQMVAANSDNPVLKSSMTVTLDDQNSIEAQQTAYSILFGN